VCDVFYYSRERCLLRLWYSISLFAILSSRITPRGASGVETQGLSGACPWFPWAIASINSVSFRTGDMASAKATAALALCAVVTRVLLAFFGWHDVLSSRVELTSPVDSIRRLKEGTALVALRMSPYHGSVVHAPPLVLFLLAPVLDYAEGMNNASVKAIVTIAPFLLADLFAAAALFSLAKRFDASLVVKRKDLDTKETLVQTSNPALVQKTNPALCVSLYLANPMTIGAYFPLTTFRLPVCPYKTDIYFYNQSVVRRGEQRRFGYRVCRDRVRRRRGWRPSHRGRMLRWCGVPYRRTRSAAALPDCVARRGERNREDDVGGFGRRKRGWWTRKFGYS
jgi:hypothetical protein